MGRLWGSGYDKGPLPASKVDVDTFSFSGNLSILDDTVQKALETLDQVILGSATWDSITGDQSDIDLSGFNNDLDFLLDAPIDTKVYGRQDGDWVEVTGGSGATTWAELDKTVSDIADITDKSHTDLDDIGTNSHATIDEHIADTDNPHSVTAAQTSAVALTGNETIGGIKTFSALPRCDETPTLDNELVTKTYVDTFSQGLVAKEAVSAATTENITLANEQTIDGVPLTAGDRCLVKDQSTGADNGIYTVVDGGAWTRTPDYNADNEVVEGTFCYVLGGTDNGGYQFVQTTKAPELGVDTLTFVLLNAPSVYTAGDGLELDGVEFGLDLKSNDGLAIKSTELGVDYDDSTIGIVSNKLAVKEDGILNTHLGEAVSVVNGGTGLSALGTANQVLGINNDGDGAEYKSIVGGSNVTVTHDGDEIEISSSLTGAPDFTYSDITLHSHPASSFTYTNLPAAVTAASRYLRRKVDLTGAVQYRLVVNQVAAGFAGSKLRMRYSLNNSTWFDIDSDNSGDLDVGTGTGVKTGTWVDIVAGAKQDVWLQLYGLDGDGVVDPTFRQIQLQIKYNSSIVDGSASDTVYKEVTIHAHSTSNSVWTNMPLALTEFMATQYATRRKVNLSNCTHYRICVNQAVAGFAGSDFNVEYSTNGTTFQALDTLSAGELDVGTGVGVKYGAWAAINDGAKGDVWLRIVGKDGDGVVDPSWRWIAIQLKEYTYGQGVAGDNMQVLYNDEGSTGADEGMTYNKAESSLRLLGSVAGSVLAAVASGFDEDEGLNNPFILLTNEDDPNGYLSLMLYNPTLLNTIFTLVEPDFGVVEGASWDFVGDVKADNINANGICSAEIVEGENIVGENIVGENIVGDTVGGGQIYNKIGNEYTFNDISDDMESAGRTSDFDGRYLFVGTYYEGAHTQSTFRIYDCIDPANPVLVSPLVITGTPANEAGGIKGIRYHDDHCYVTYASVGENAFRIFDVTDRTAPVVVGGVGLTTLPDLGGGATLDVDTVNLVAYLAGPDSITSVDVSDPSAPAILDDIAMTGFGLWTCKYSNGYVYAGGRNNLTTGNTLHIIDVSDPEDMTEVTPTEALDLKEGMWTLIVEGNYVYIAAGGSFSNNKTNNKFYVIDVTTKNTPTIVSELFISASDCSYLRKTGDFIYLSCWTVHPNPNLFVINVKDPSNPHIVNAVSVGDFPVNLYPAFGGRYVYVMFAPFAREYPFVGVVTPGSVQTFNLNVETGENTHIKSDELEIDLGVLVEGYKWYLPLLEAKSHENMELFSLEYGLGIYDKLLILDKSDSGRAGINISKLDIISGSANLDYIFSEERWELLGDFCADSNDYADEIYHDIGQSGLEWNDGWFRGDVHADTFQATTSITIGSTTLTEADLISLLALL